jgi:arsenate reductase
MSIQKVLFICTGNSCRSQMVEGFANHYGQGEIQAFSAGLEPSRVNPLAIRMMAEKGVTISHHTSKSIDSFDLQQMDMVVSVCSNADERCPLLPPNVRRERWPFDDPPHLATGLSEEDALPIYRRVRDEIEAKIQAWLRSSGKG